jgi:hypothetical protein
MTLRQRYYETKHKADALTRQIGKEWNFEIYATEKISVCSCDIHLHSITPVIGKFRTRIGQQKSRFITEAAFAVVCVTPDGLEPSAL